MDIPAAGAIVFDSHRRLLLIQRGRPPAELHWSVPGGKCLDGEPAADACVREVMEETGLLVRAVRHAGRVCRPALGDDRFLIDDFVCEVVGGQLRAADDAVAAGWFDRAALQDLRMVPELVETLRVWQLLPD